MADLIITRTCRGCGSEFHPNGGRGRPRVFCSDECRLAHPEAQAAAGESRSKQLSVAVAPSLVEPLERAAARSGLPSISAWLAELVEDTLALEAAADEILGLVEGVEAPPFQFELERLDGLLFVRAKLWRRDTETGEMGWGYSARYLVHARMVSGEIVKKCFVAARDFAEHEVREGFMWNGRRILSPHIPISRMWDMAEGV